MTGSTGSVEVGLGRSRRRIGWHSAPKWGRVQLGGYLYLLPAMAVYAAFVIYPFIQGVWISLFEWKGYGVATWVGLDNYLSILTDSALRSGFGRALVLIVFYSFIPIALGLLITAVLSTRPVRGASIYRMILFVPQVLPIIVIGIVWRWMYNPDGPINAALTSIGLGDLTRVWLGDFTLALPAVGLVGSWVSFGFIMVLMLAGVQQIPRELYDAARVDGAGRVQEFFAVTLPGLRNQLIVAATVTVITAFRAFGLIFSMTDGGPGTETTVPAWQVYTTSFRFGQVGLGTALGITLAIVIFGAVLVLRRVSERGER